MPFNLWLIWLVNLYVGHWMIMFYLYFKLEWCEYFHLILNVERIKLENYALLRIVVVNSWPIFANNCSIIFWDASVFCMNKISKDSRELKWILKFLANLGNRLSLLSFIGKSWIKFCLIVCIIWEDMCTDLLEANMYLIKKSCDTWIYIKGMDGCAVWR